MYSSSSSKDIVYDSASTLTNPSAETVITNMHVIHTKLLFTLLYLTNASCFTVNERQTAALFVGWWIFFGDGCVGFCRVCLGGGGGAVSVGGWGGGGGTTPCRATKAQHRCTDHHRNSFCRTWDPSLAGFLDELQSINGFLSGGARTSFGMGRRWAARAIGPAMSPFRYSHGRGSLRQPATYSCNEN